MLNVTFYGVRGEAPVLPGTASRYRANTACVTAYRIESEGVSVAYVGDHRVPPALDTVDRDVLELADGVDLFVHAAQHTAAEWESQWDGGHSTVDDVVAAAEGTTVSFERGGP